MKKHRRESDTETRRIVRNPERQKELDRVKDAVHIVVTAAVRDYLRQYPENIGEARKYVTLEWALREKEWLHQNGLSAATAPFRHMLIDAIIASMTFALA